MTEIILDLKDESNNILEKLSTKQNISKKKLCEMIIETWTAFGGRIWAGDYKNTRAFIIDWPIKRKIVKS